jgi:two-component system CheB/CheR fusion protein
MRDRVLVVDDNQDFAQSLVDAITRYGYPAKAVYSGEEAIRETASFLPDMVLVDLSMPELDGCETIARMRQKRPAAEIIMVAVTGLAGAEHRQRAYDAGFDLFVSKPLGADKLRELLALLDPAIATSTRTNERIRAHQTTESGEPLLPNR